MLNDKTILVTGGTGSFGKQFVKTVLQKYSPKKLIIFSRDELKQFEMSQHFSEEQYPCIRYFIGDIRDKERLIRAFKGVDYVIHAAALKHIPICEYNPFEAIKTNVIGVMNIIDAALETGVKRVIALSTDKACSPVNLYGATKLCLEKLFTQANSYSGETGTRFSCVRYGNVIASRGSVIPFFLQERKKGVIPITDERMTRFWMTLDQAVELVLTSLARMYGGETFIPKISSMRVVDLAKAVAPECSLKIIGTRPSEKLHELLISIDENNRASDLGDCYALFPEFSWWASEKYQDIKKVEDGFSYSSLNNTQWLSVDDLRRLVNQLENKHEF